MARPCTIHSLQNVFTLLIPSPGEPKRHALKHLCHLLATQSGGEVKGGERGESQYHVIVRRQWLKQSITVPGHSLYIPMPRGTPVACSIPYPSHTMHHWAGFQGFSLVHVQVGWELGGGGGGGCRCRDVVSVLRCSKYCRIILLITLTTCQDTVED